MTKKIKSSLELAIAFFMLLITFSQQGCISNQGINESKEGEWRIVKTGKNDIRSWTVYSRKLKGTNFLEYKIEGAVSSSPKSCLSAFRQEIYDQAINPNNKKYPKYEIMSESKDSLLTYVIHAEPFPLKNTEMSVRYIFEEGKNGTRVVRWKEAWDTSPVPPTKKLSRVDTFRGSWNFSPISDNSCKAVNSVQFDPKKNAFMVNTEAIRPDEVPHAAEVQNPKGNVPK